MAERTKSEKTKSEKTKSEKTKNSSQHDTQVTLRSLVSLLGSTIKDASKTFSESLNNSHVEIKSGLLEGCLNGLFCGSKVSLINVEIHQTFTGTEHRSKEHE